MSHADKPSPPPVTYTARKPLGSQILVCTRCTRAHVYPQPGARAVRCECGWRYTNHAGHIIEEFAPRIGA